jgi:hypothetical protein
MMSYADFLWAQLSYFPAHDFGDWGLAPTDKQIGP